VLHGGVGSRCGKVFSYLLALLFGCCYRFDFVLMGGFCDFRTLRRCASDHEVSATALQCSGVDWVF
jgi:hypothetical protein